MTGRERIQKVSSAIQKNRYVSAISNGLVATLPALIVGAIFTLIDTINIGPWQTFLYNTGLKEFTGLPLNVTTNIISIYAVIGIAYAFAKSFGKDKDAFSPAIVALMSFFIVTPITVLDAGWTTVNAFEFTWLGSQGLFVAIIMALLMARLFIFISDKGWYIKMPKGVPPTIEKSFAAIVPGLITITVALIVAAIFANTNFGHLHEFMFSLVQRPLTNLGGTWWAYLIGVAAMSIFWFFGVHGTMVIISIMIPMWMAAGAENLAAFQAGYETLPNMIPGLSFLVVYTNIGGAMAAFGLPVLMLIAKSKRHKTLGKLSILPAIFGINEPVIFGTPLVLNFKYLIPVIVAPVVISGLAIIATYTGIVPPLRGTGVPLGTPIFISGFLEGGIRVAILQLILAVVSIAIYLPFFRSADVEAAAAEEAAAEVAVAELAEAK